MKGTGGSCSVSGGGGGRLVTGMPDLCSAPGCLQLCQREDGVRTSCFSLAFLCSVLQHNQPPPWPGTDAAWPHYPPWSLLIPKTSSGKPSPRSRAAGSTRPWWKLVGRCLPSGAAMTTVSPWTASRSTPPRPTSGLHCPPCPQPGQGWPWPPWARGSW